jgi:hypothetical protein
MANDLFTVADFVADALDVDPTTTSEVLNAAPLVSAIPISDTSDGSETHQYNKYTGAPVVGFRSPNAGRDYDHSVDTVVSVACTILDFSWRVDYAVANAWRRGPQDLIAREGMRHLAAALYKLETQCIYGTDATLGDANGFSGMLQSTDLDALADDMVVGAGGTTASTQNSVWAIKTGFNDVRLVTPMDRGITLGDTIVTEANDSNHPVYYTPASMYVGLQLGGKYSIGRIANLHPSDSGAQLDDDLLSDILSQFPAGMGPDVFVMNRTRLKELQQSRTATNVTGAPAPFPNASFGVPIITTDASVNTEAVET